MSVPKYGDFGKPAADCLDAGDMDKTQCSLQTKVASGESITVTQTFSKKVEKDTGKPNVVTKLALKFGKGKGLKLDKFTASSNKGFELAGSYGGLHPDLNVDMKAKCDPTKTDFIGKVPGLQTLDMGLHYTQSNLAANLGITKEVDSVKGKFDLLYAQAGALVGGDVAFAHKRYASDETAKKEVGLGKVNLKMGYTMDQMSCFLQSDDVANDVASGLKLQLYNKWSDVMATGVEVSTEREKPKTKDEAGALTFKPAVGCKYTVDDDTEVVGKMSVALYPDIQVLFKQNLTSAACLNATFKVDVGDLEKLGMAFGFEFGDI